jgi:hypothetical protein
MIVTGLPAKSGGVCDREQRPVRWLPTVAPHYQRSHASSKRSVQTSPTRGQMTANLCSCIFFMPVITLIEFGTPLEITNDGLCAGGDGGFGFGSNANVNSLWNNITNGWMISIVHVIGPGRKSR